jgi:hypothetical protein
MDPPKPEHDGIAVAAVARHHQVISLAGGKRADDAGLGAIGQMRVPANDARMLNESSLDSFFEFADTHHLRIHPDQAAFFEFFLLCLWHGSFLPPPGLGY